jgi:pimeloyl-ACP methyl ester carboxylesterase
VTTFVLIHGGGGSAWDWHLVVPALHERGHDAVAVDLPRANPAAGWWTYVDTVVRAVGDRRRLVVVGHSLGAFTAPLVSARLPVELFVLLAGMIPSPGELFSDWWRNVGYDSSGDDDVFYHDVPPELAAEAQRREGDEASRALNEPWPLDAWPDVPTKFVLCTEDRFFPADFLRRVVAERLHIIPDEIAASHCVALSRPKELAEILVRYAATPRRSPRSLATK